MNIRPKNQNRRKKPTVNKKKKPNNEGFRTTRHMLGFPPQIRSKPIFTRVLRYRVATAFTDKALAMNSLLFHIVTTTNASSTAYSVIDSIKLNRITIYSVPSANFGGSANEISFKWQNLGTFGNVITDRGTLTDPAKIVAIPPESSLISFAFNVNDANLATNFCNINAPAESIIDFHVSFTLLDAAATSVTLTGNASLTGVQFVSISLGTLIPDGVVNTVVTTSI